MCVVLLCAGTVKRRAGSCCGSALDSFLPVTSCCLTSRSSSSPRNTTLWLQTVCSGCRRHYGNRHTQPKHTLYPSGKVIIILDVVCVFVGTAPGSTPLTWWRWRPFSTRPRRSSTRSTSLTSQTRSVTVSVRKIDIQENFTFDMAELSTSHSLKDWNTTSPGSFQEGVRF